MVVVLKHGVAKESRDQLISWLKNLGLNIHVSEGSYQTILGLVGDTTRVDMAFGLVLLSPFTIFAA